MLLNRLIVMMALRQIFVSGSYLDLIFISYLNLPICFPLGFPAPKSVRPLGTQSPIFTPTHFAYKTALFHIKYISKFLIFIVITDMSEKYNINTGEEVEDKYFITYVDEFT